MSSPEFHQSGQPAFDAADNQAKAESMLAHAATMEAAAAALEAKRRAADPQGSELLGQFADARLRAADQLYARADEIKNRDTADTNADHTEALVSAADNLEESAAAKDLHSRIAEAQSEGDAARAVVLEGAAADRARAAEALRRRAGVDNPVAEMPASDSQQETDSKDQVA